MLATVHHTLLSSLDCFHTPCRIYDLKGSERSRFNADAAANPQDAGEVHLDDNLRRANLQVRGPPRRPLDHHLLALLLAGWRSPCSCLCSAWQGDGAAQVWISTVDERLDPLMPLPPLPCSRSWLITQASHPSIIGPPGADPG